MTEAQLMQRVKQIRAQASLGDFEILRNNKIPQDGWKNKLLNCLSNDVVFNHLRNLHPFQFFNSTNNYQVMEFLVPYYRWQLYVKVNLQTKQVLSFHYSEDPVSGEITTASVDTLYHSRTDDWHSLHVIPSNEDVTKCYIAVGNGIVPCQITDVSANGFISYTDVSSYEDAIKLSAKKPIKALQRLADALDWNVISPSLNPKDFNLLTLVQHEDQLISFLFDVLATFPQEYYIRDMLIAELIKYPPAILARYEFQLQKTMIPIPIRCEIPDSFNDSPDVTREFP